MPRLNPDQSLLHDFASGNKSLAPITSNPMAQALSAHLVRVDIEGGVVELCFEPASLFLQGAGLLQGGAVTAMLDFSMAFAALAVLQPGQSCATASLAVSFLRPAPLGSYMAIGEVERRGGKAVFTRARLLSSGREGSVIATANSVLLVVSSRPTET